MFLLLFNDEPYTLIKVAGFKQSTAVSSAQKNNSNSLISVSMSGMELGKKTRSMWSLATNGFNLSVKGLLFGSQP